MDINWVYGLVLAAAAALVTILVLSHKFDDTLSERCTLVILAIGLIAEAYAVFAHGQPGRFVMELSAAVVAVGVAFSDRMLGIRWARPQAPVRKRE